MLDLLKGFGKRKPSREELYARISQSLEKSPMAESRQQFDREITDLD